MAEPLAKEINAPGGKVVVAGTITGGTFNLGEARKLVRLWVEVPPLPSHPVVGRNAVLAELRARLCGAEGVAAVSALDGLPGVGKTTVAVRLAWDREVVAHFRGGVLWAGLGPKGDAAGALRRWGDALGVDLGAAPDAAALARKLSPALQEKAQGEPVLLVVDDVWAWDQVEPFQKIALPGCAHLVTTRDRDLARRFADRETRVEVLPEAEAEEFVIARCPTAREADPAAFRTLVAAVGGLPLGLTLIAEELRRHEGQASWVKRAMERMAAAEARLALAVREGRPGLEGVPLTLQAVVELSVGALGAEDQAGFAALGAFAPKPADFGKDAVFAVWEVGEEEGDARLLRLRERGLVEESGEGRFALHQVLGAVAEARLGGERGPRERHAGFYGALMEADKEDWQRIEAELEQIRRGWAWLVCVEDGAAGVLRYVEAIRIYHDRRGLPEERLDWLERGLVAARSLKESRVEAAVLSNIGGVHSHLGDKARALEYYDQSLAIRRAVGDRAGEAVTLNNIGTVHSSLGDKARALEYFDHALAIHRAVGDRVMEATTLSNIGGVHSDLGDNARALEYYDQALPIRRAVGDRAGEAATLNNIGAVHSSLGDKARALEYYDQALALIRTVGDRAGEAVTLVNIAVIRDVQGKTDEAIALLERVVEIREAIQHPDLASDRAVLARLRAKRDAPPPPPAAAPLRRPYATVVLLALALAAAVGWFLFSK